MTSQASHARTPDAAEDDVASIVARLRQSLHRELPPDALDPSIVPPHGDQSLNEWDVAAEFLASARIAAVLVGLVPRDGHLNILLTQRTMGLRDHSGQVAFPGGKMDPDDSSPAATAIREAHEEVGLPARTVDILGYLDPYLTRTGFRIVPVVALVTPPFDLMLNPAEVVEAFEVPFGFAMDAANHRLSQREWLGKQRYFYTIEYGERLIWGVTAGILRVLADRLASP